MAKKTAKPTAMRPVATAPAAAPGTEATMAKPAPLPATFQDAVIVLSKRHPEWTQKIARRKTTHAFPALYAEFLKSGGRRV